MLTKMLTYLSSETVATEEPQIHNSNFRSILFPTGSNLDTCIELSLEAEQYQVTFEGNTPGSQRNSFHMF